MGDGWRRRNKNRSRSTTVMEAVIQKPIFKENIRKGGDIERQTEMIRIITRTVKKMMEE